MRGVTPDGMRNDSISALDLPPISPESCAMNDDVPPGGLSSLREANRARILNELRQHAALSRADLARATGLSRTTVSSLVAELQERGLVREGSVPEPRGTARGAGRPGTLVSLTAAQGVVLGVDLDHSHVRVALADTTGAVLAERQEQVDVDHSAELALDRAAQLVQDVLADGGRTPADVLSVVMGVPGPLDRAAGRLLSDAILPGWLGLTPASALEARIGLAVTVDNDANLGALGEVAFGAARGLE